MNRNNCPEAAQLAALLDGRLARRERTAVLRHLDECEDCFEWFCEARGALAAEAGEESDPGESSGVEPRVQKWGRWRWLALAAALLVGAFFLFRAQPEQPQGQLAVMLDPLIGAGRPLSPHLTRPSDPGFSNPPTGREGFFLGITIVDLYAAARENRPDESRRLADRGVFLLRAGADDEVRRNIAKQMEESVSPDRILSWDAGLEASIGDDYRLGRWAEALRLAAEAGDVDYLLSPDTERLLPVEVESRLPAAVRGALTGIRTASDTVDRADRVSELRRRLGDWIRTPAPGPE